MARIVEGSRGRPVVELDEGEVFTGDAARMLGVGQRDVLHLIGRKRIEGRRFSAGAGRRGQWIVTVASIRRHMGDDTIRPPRDRRTRRVAGAGA